MPIPSEALLFTVTETSQLLDLSRPKVYLLIQEKLLDAVKIGNDWRIRRSSLEKLGWNPSWNTATEPQNRISN